MLSPERLVRSINKFFRKFAISRKRLGISFSLIIFAIYFLSAISIYSFRDASDFSSKPAVDLYSYEPADGYYERVEDLVREYRLRWDEQNDSRYRAPMPTEILFNIQRAYDIDEVRNTISLEGDITATWIDSSIRDYENLGSSVEISNARADVLSESFLNFTDADNQLFEKVWEYKAEVDIDEHGLGPEHAGETIHRVNYRFHGLFPLVQNYQKFPFDTAEIVLRLTSKLEAPNVYMFADESSSEESGQHRVNSFMYEKQSCIEGEEKFYNCVSDDIKVNGPYFAVDDISGLDKEKLKTFYYDAVSAETSAATHHFLRRSAGTSFFRFLLPLCISIFVVAVVDQLDISSWEIKLATPPTILLTLMFMQSGYQASFSQISYITFMDKIYLLAYLLTMLALVRAILEKKRQRLLFRSSSTKGLTRAISFARSLFVLGATVAPFVIYKFS